MIIDTHRLLIVKVGITNFLACPKKTLEFFKQLFNNSRAGHPNNNNNNNKQDYVKKNIVFIL